jgi:uncharacterized protein (TIGR03000 family)
MNRPVPIGRALITAILAAGSVQAQATNPNGSSYPYWGSAPQSYSGSQVTVPGMSPGTISNAAQSPPSPTSAGIGIGGGYLPPLLTARQTGADNKVHIWLRVPANAEIWVNGVKTKQSGESRYFFSPPLTPGRKYNYQMRLRWTKDGKPVEQTQNILVQAGETIRRDFSLPDKIRNPKSEIRKKSE